MNNSLPRLYEGMAQALREHVLPAIDGEFPRGQVFGVIFMLNSLGLRTSWSPDFLRAQIALQRELAAAVPSLPEPAPRLTPAMDGTPDLLAAYDATEHQICALIDWLAQGRNVLPPADSQAIEAALSAYLSQKIRFELTTSARPMFREISLGTEDKEAT